GSCRVRAEWGEAAPIGRRGGRGGRWAAGLRWGWGTTAVTGVEAAAVARTRRREMGMRTGMEPLRLQEGGEDGGRLSQNADDYVTLSTSHHELPWRGADCSTVSASSNAHAAGRHASPAQAGRGRSRAGRAKLRDRGPKIPATSPVASLVCD